VLSRDGVQAVRADEKVSLLDSPAVEVQPYSVVGSLDSDRTVVGVHRLSGDAARQCGQQRRSKNHETRCSSKIGPQLIELEKAERTSLRVGPSGYTQGMSASAKVISDAKLVETFHRVGPKADPGPDLAKLGRLLEDLRVKPDDAERDCRTEAADTSP
jgi:hypothetical protein